MHSSTLNSGESLLLLNRHGGNSEYRAGKDKDPGSLPLPLAISVCVAEVDTVHQPLPHLSAFLLAPVQTKYFPAAHFFTTCLKHAVQFQPGLL